MGWRGQLEDHYTVACARCGHEQIDPRKRPRQKYLLNEACPRCGHVRRRT